MERGGHRIFAEALRKTVIITIEENVNVTEVQVSAALICWVRTVLGISHRDPTEGRLFVLLYESEATTGV